MSTTSRIAPAALTAATAFMATAGVAAQEAQRAEVARVEVAPAALTLQVGEKAQLSATAYDAGGDVVDVPFLFFSREGRGRLAVDADHRRNRSLQRRGVRREGDSAGAGPRRRDRDRHRAVSPDRPRGDLRGGRPLLRRRDGATQGRRGRRGRRCSRPRCRLEHFGRIGRDRRPVRGLPGPRARRSDAFRGGRGRRRPDRI